MSILLQIAGNVPTSDSSIPSGAFDPVNQTWDCLSRVRTVREAIEVLRIDATTGCGSTSSGQDADPDDQ